MMVVIGLGSPFLSDDSIGPRIVRELSCTDGPTMDGLGIRLVESHAGGLLLLEELAGADSAIIVDALVNPELQPGEVVVAGIEGATKNVSCSHDCSLSEALAIGRSLGLAVPDDDKIRLVAVVARDVTTFSETLSPAVEASVRRACSAVRGLIESRDVVAGAHHG